MTNFWARHSEGAYLSSSMSRGGRFQEILAMFVNRDGEDEMRPNPTLRAFFGPCRQSVEVQQAFQSFESEFDIPLTLPLII